MRAAMTLLAMLMVAAPPLIASAAPSDGADGKSYPVDHAAASGPASHGWGVYARLQGRSIDLRARSQGWSDDPGSRPGDVQAGLGWRNAHFSSVIGYQQVDFGRGQVQGSGVDPMNTGREHESTQAVLGLGFSFRR